MITSINEFKIFESKLKSDAVGYDIGKYIYHVTPVSNLNGIKKHGFRPKDGVSINGEEYEDRLYFATSLIAAYDLVTNFQSYKNNEKYIILKLKSVHIDDYNEDPLFQHGIYIDYTIPYSDVVEIYNYSDLFDKFSDDDFDALYESNNQQIIPNRFVYHQSNPIFRDKIKNEGLIPKAKSETWLSNTKIDGKVIFASNTSNKRDWFDSGYDDDIYMIDTTKISNEWYLDPNFNDKKYIITYKPIHTNAIKLIYKGNYKKLD